jgi:hypothetical protein
VTSYAGRGRSALGRRMVDAFAGWEWLAWGVALAVGLAQSRASRARVDASAG